MFSTSLQNVWNNAKEFVRPCYGLCFLVLGVDGHTAMVVVVRGHSVMVMMLLSRAVAVLVMLMECLTCYVRSH